MGTGIQANDDAVLIEVAGLLDTMAEKQMAEAIRGRSDAKFTRTLPTGIKFVSPILKSMLE
jgi:hypothetical protein